MIKKPIYIHKSDKGLTLVETLVAISILSISILATFTAVQGGLQSSNYVKDQIIAFYLTQEAMEYIKNTRDENALNSLSTGFTVHWLKGLSELSTDPCYAATNKVCTIDTPNDTVANCPGSPAVCPNLRQDPTTGLYSYTGSWNSTNFNREIRFTNISAEEVKVTIKISWVTRGIAHNFETSQLLFNRQ